MLCLKILFKAFDLVRHDQGCLFSCTSCWHWQCLFVAVAIHPGMIFHPQGESTCWILQIYLCQWSDVDACIILFSPIMGNIQLYIYTVILGKLAFFNEMCVYVLTHLVHVCTCLLLWSSGTTAVDKTWTASGLTEHFLIDWRKIVLKEKGEIKSYHSFQHLRWDGEFKSYCIKYQFWRSFTVRH